MERVKKILADFEEALKNNPPYASGNNNELLIYREGDHINEGSGMVEGENFTLNISVEGGNFGRSGELYLVIYKYVEVWGTDGESLELTDEEIEEVKQWFESNAEIV